MAISSQGTTFSFPGFPANIVARYTSISVQEAEAEIVDMTTPSDPLGQRRMVATGDVTQPATVRVDYLRTPQTIAPSSMVGLAGTLSVANAAASLSISVPAILQSTSTEISAGELIRGTMNFVVTNQIIT